MHYAAFSTTEVKTTKER